MYGGKWGAIGRTMEVELWMYTEEEFHRARATYEYDVSLVRLICKHWPTFFQILGYYYNGGSMIIAVYFVIIHIFLNVTNRRHMFDSVSESHW